MPEPPVVTQAMIMDALKQVGVRPGGSVFVHSSLSRFGQVHGGAASVCVALVMTVGTKGTVLMPAFTFGLKEKPNAVLDMANEPSCVGAISEAFRKSFAKHRSRHITHSVSAWGARAEFFTKTHNRGAFDRRSPFRRLVETNAMIVLMGVDYNRCSFFLAIEGALPVPYFYEEPATGAEVRFPDGHTAPAECSVHTSTMQYDFNRAAELLESKGLVKQAACGGSIVRGFRAKPVYELVLDRLRDDPMFLAERWNRVQIPVSV